MNVEKTKRSFLKLVNEIAKAIKPIDETKKWNRLQIHNAMLYMVTVFADAHVSEGNQNIARVLSQTMIENGREIQHKINVGG